MRLNLQTFLISVDYIFEGGGCVQRLNVTYKFIGIGIFVGCTVSRNWCQEHLNVTTFKITVIIKSTTFRYMDRLSAPLRTAIIDF